MKEYFHDPDSFSMLFEERKNMKKAAEIRNFAIAGHAGSGKTTLAEMLVFKGKGITRRGTVEGKNTISDFTPEEQERGGSIYSTQLNTQW